MYVDHIVFRPKAFNILLAAFYVVQPNWTTILMVALNRILVSLERRDDFQIGSNDLKAERTMLI